MTVCLLVCSIPHADKVQGAQVSPIATVYRSIQQAGLRNLPGVFVIDIQRADGTVVAAPGPDTILLLGDTITFAGDVAEVKTVLELGGLQAVGEWQDSLSSAGHIMACVRRACVWCVHVRVTA
jgi:hypothetical protein